MPTYFEKLSNNLSNIADRAFVTYTGLVNNLINSESTDSQQIEHLLDHILDVCFDNRLLALFKKLCRYYYAIAPKATADYVCFYHEMYENED